MYIIADSRMPKEAKESLERIGRVLWIEEENLAYPAIACHPDIFFCEADNALIAAKNAPKNVVRALQEGGVRVVMGSYEVGAKYPASARYNAVVTSDFVVRNTKIENVDFQSVEKSRSVVHVAQGYVRCNLVSLGGRIFLSSDRGIERALTAYGCEVMWVSPDDIVLPTVDHGFFGGCCGIFEDTLHLIGSLEFHPQGAEIQRFVYNNGLKINELYHGKLWDGGGVFFWGD